MNIKKQMQWNGHYGKIRKNYGYDIFFDICVLANCHLGKNTTVIY